MGKLNVDGTELHNSRKFHAKRFISLVQIIRRCNGIYADRFYIKFQSACFLIQFAVIISKTQNKYVFCKHKDRDTWEVPGGHRESQENIIDTAKSSNAVGYQDMSIFPAIRPLL